MIDKQGRFRFSLDKTISTNIKNNKQLAVRLESIHLSTYIAIYSKMIGGMRVFLCHPIHKNNRVQCTRASFLFQFL